MKITDYISEADISLYTGNFDDKGFQKFLRENKISTNIVEEIGSNGTHKRVTYEGPKKVLQTLVEQWFDKDLVDFINVILPTSEMLAEKENIPIKQVEPPNRDSKTEKPILSYVKEINDKVFIAKLVKTADDKFYIDILDDKKVRPNSPFFVNKNAAIRWLEDRGFTLKDIYESKVEARHILNELINRTDIRKIEPGEKVNGWYEIHLDLEDYVHGYGNDRRIFNAIEKISGVKWKFIDIRHSKLNMKTQEYFKPFTLDLGKLDLIRHK